MSDVRVQASTVACAAIDPRGGRVQVLQRMLPDSTECFTFLAGDVDARLFDGDIPANMFSVWVVCPPPHLRCHRSICFILHA